MVAHLPEPAHTTTTDLQIPLDYPEHLHSALLFNSHSFNTANPTLIHRIWNHAKLEQPQNRPQC